MTVKPLIAAALCCIVCLLSISTTVNSQVNQVEPLNDPLEEFLVRNGLTRLLITHREVLAESGLDDRVTAIQRLQQSYARELFRQFDGEAWSQAVLTKAKASIAANPNQKSEHLRLAVSHREVDLLQRDYLLGGEVTETDVDRIIEEINLIQRGVKQQIDNLDRLVELNQTGAGDAIGLHRLRQQFRHGEFLQGWSHFLKSAAGGRHSKPVLRDAESYFRSFLELDPHTNLTKFSADQFGHQSRFQKLATAGLGAVMYGIGADKQATRCFKIAEENANLGLTAEQEVSTIQKWQFVGYLRNNRPQAAKMLERKPMLLREEMLIGAILKRSDVADALFEKALVGLALRFDSDQLRETLEAFPDSLPVNSKDPQTTALGHWIRGYLLLDDFQKNLEEASLRQATGKLSAAAEKLDPQTPPEVRGHCRFLLGSCFHLNRRYPEAAREFLGASATMRDDRDLAAESAYRALGSMRLSSGEQEANRKNIVTWLNAHFPASPFTRLANFEVDLDRQSSLSDEDAVAHLSRLRENETSLLVRSAISEELARRYRLAPNLPIAQFRDYVETIRIDDRVSDEAQIQINFYYVSKLLAQARPSRSAKEIDESLENVKELMDGSDSTKNKTDAAAKFLYFQSLVLRTLHPKNHRRADGYFQRIKQLNNPSPWKATAAIEIAKIYENAEDNVEVDAPVFRGKMIGVYELLSKLKNSAESSNAKVVSLKLAKLYLADDRLLEAEELVQDSQPDVLWLPLRASLAEKKNDPRQSASLWQQLEELSPKGSETWFDARWKRILVLHQFDETNATELLIRTMALHPNMPPTFATRFRQLADKWGIQ